MKPRFSMYATCLLIVWGAGTPAESAAMEPGETAPMPKRTLDLDSRETFSTFGVSYGPFRDGQRPGGPTPNRDQLLEDLRILQQHWSVIRLYGAGEPSGTICDLIREHDLGIRVIVGAWIANEVSRDESRERLPEKAAENQAEVAQAIRLANAYPDVVVAVTVGNETQVFWSGHKVRLATLIGYVREVRAATRVPVSTADVCTFWAKPESRALAAELDFVMTHIYPFWNGKTVDGAMDWTREQYALNARQHPDHLLVIGEAGWPTSRVDYGDEGKYAVGEANEETQRRYIRDLLAWTTSERILCTVFSAFDEKWKGGKDPLEAEKNWGLYRADRTPKSAVAELP